MKNSQFTILIIVFAILLVNSFSSVAGQNLYDVDSHMGQDSDDNNTKERHLLHEVRVANAKYHDLNKALDDGYGEFLSCFTYSDKLGMGQHYIQGDLVSDKSLDPLTPEALVYEPGSNGEMNLVAVEYLIFADVWDPDKAGRGAPTLFGQNFSLETEIPDTPPVWALHVWLFAHNPDGLYAHFNPIVFCPDDAPVVDMAMADE